MALIACTVMLFEVLVTRVLSVTLSYHFAFLAISLAMLGLAAPGVWFSLTPPGPSAIFPSLYASALALPASVLAVTYLGSALRPVLTFWIVIILIPMLTLGAAVCILLLRARGRDVGRMYGCDLAGAAAGAVLAVPLLDGLPTPCVIAALGLLPLAAAVLLGSRNRRLAGGLAVILTSTAIWGVPYHLRYSRFYVETRPPLYERWTPTARIAIFDQANPSFLGWGMGLNYHGPTMADHLWLDQDGSAGTPILSYKPGTPYPSYLAYDVVSAAYPIVMPTRACIVGGGGGRDILKALQGGATDVEVVELNPFTVDAVSRVFGPYSGDPYHLPGVSAFVGEGRNHFMRSTTPCDVLEISQIDTFAASAAGAYALSENSLYTVEAVRMFWSHLTSRGALSISRWVSGPAWPESVRLVLLEVEALRQEGVSDPKAHMIVLAAGDTANVLLFRARVSPAVLESTRTVASSRGFAILWPAGALTSDAAPLTKALINGPDEMTSAGYDVSAPTDDRPFFFQMQNVLSGPWNSAKAMTEREQSVVLLQLLVLVLTSLTFLMVILPVFASGRVPRGQRLAANTLFFGAIGFGFMFVEIPLLQRLTIYLGHPSYATTVVLGSVLVGAGVGARLASKIPDEHRRQALLGSTIVVGVLVYCLFVLAARTIEFAFWSRVLVATAMLTATGVFLGLPFPVGMRCFDDRGRSWYWAVNGAASVLASVLAIVIALLGGFSAVVAVALACYLLAAATLPRLPSSRSDLDHLRSGGSDGVHERLRV